MAPRDSWPASFYMASGDRLRHEIALRFKLERPGTKDDERMIVARMSKEQAQNIVRQLQRLIENV